MSPRLLAAAGALLVAASVALPAQAATTPPVRSQVLFWLIDRNGDGVVDRNEIDALRAKIFDSLDSNHDGRLTKDEVAAVAAQARARIADRLAARIKGGLAGADARRNAIIGRLGLDQPGGVSRPDFLAREPALFGRVDANGDGAVSQAEFAAAAERGPLGLQ